MKFMSKTAFRNLLAVGGFLVLSTAYVVHDGHSSSSGVTGSTNKPGSFPGCSCHNADASEEVNVQITTTATTFEPGKTYRFRVTASASGQAAAGINIAKFLPGQDTTQSSRFKIIPNQGLKSGGATQLTHTSPKDITSLVTWDFEYVAPPLEKGSDTLYATVNAVNFNGGADPGDLWNIAEKFVINVTSNAVSPRNDIAEAFAIGSNPATEYARLYFTMKKPADLRVALMDATGREVYVQHKGELSFGRGEVMLDLHGLAAGDYIVNVTSGGSLLYTGKLAHTK